MGETYHYLTSTSWKCCLRCYYWNQVIPRNPLQWEFKIEDWEFKIWIKSKLLNKRLLEIWSKAGIFFCDDRNYNSCKSPAYFSALIIRFIRLFYRIDLVGREVLRLLPILPTLSFPNFVQCAHVHFKIWSPLFFIDGVEGGFENPNPPL